jgi:hypothetical protein
MFEISPSVFKQTRAKLREQFVEALRIVLDTVESVEDTLGYHPAKPLFRRAFRFNDLLQIYVKPFDDSVDVRESDLFFALEMQVNAALADADLLGEIVNGHLFITVSGKQPVGSVKYRVACCFRLGCVSHNLGR